MVNKNIKEINWLVIFFIVFVVFYIFHNILFLKYDNSFNCLESSLETSVIWFNAFSSAPVSFLKMLRGGLFAPDRAIYDLSAWPFFCLFGISADTAVFENFIFLLLLIFAVYKIGIIIGNRTIGFFAVFQLLMYPGLFGFLRIYFTPIAVSSLISFFIYCLLSSDGLKNIKKVLLLVISFFILFKLKFDRPFIYLSVPLCIYLIKYTKFNESKFGFSRKIIVTAIISGTVLLTLFIIKEAVIARFKYYLFDVIGYTWLQRHTFFNLSLKNSFVYIYDLVSLQLGFLGFFVFILGGLSFLKVKNKYKSIMLSWIIFPVIFFSLYFFISGIHASYYTTACLPAIALISSCGIYGLLNKISKIGSIAFSVVLIALYLINYVLVSHFGMQLFLFKKIVPETFSGRMTMVESTKEKKVIDEIEKKILAIIKIKGSANVVFVNHYPILHSVYREIKLLNAIKNNKVYVYDFSEKLFNLEKTDPKELILERISSADLVANGNRFYPVKSSKIAADYLQFGTKYDFRGDLEKEEEAYSMLINNFKHLVNIRIGNCKVDLFINKKYSMVLNDG